jgi:hypothetical protein
MRLALTVDRTFAWHAFGAPVSEHSWAAQSRLIQPTLVAEKQSFLLEVDSMNAPPGVLAIPQP